MAMVTVPAVLLMVPMMTMTTTMMMFSMMSKMGRCRARHHNETTGAGSREGGGRGVSALHHI